MAKKSVQGRTKITAARPAAPDTVEDEEVVDTAYPKVKYRKVKPSAKYPNGYETRRVADEKAEAKLSADWKDSTVGMAPEFPFGHQD